MSAQHPPATWRYPTRTSVVSSARDTVLGWARSCGLTADQEDSLRLALGEAIGNAVVHAPQSGEFAITAYTDENALVIELESPGSFHPVGPATMPSPSSERGRGRALMAALLDSVEYLPAEDRTVVRMRKVLPIAP